MSVLASRAYVKFVVDERELSNLGVSLVGVASCEPICTLASSFLFFETFKFAHLNESIICAPVFSYVSKTPWGVKSIFLESIFLATRNAKRVVHAGYWAFVPRANLKARAWQRFEKLTGFRDRGGL